MLEATTLFRMEDAPLFLFDASVSFVAASARAAAAAAVPGGDVFFFFSICARPLLVSSFDASSENMVTMFPFK